MRCFLRSFLSASDSLEDDEKEPLLLSEPPEPDDEEDEELPEDWLDELEALRFLAELSLGAEVFAGSGLGLVGESFLTVSFGVESCLLATGSFLGSGTTLGAVVEAMISCIESGATNAAMPVGLGRPTLMSETASSSMPPAVPRAVASALCLAVGSSSSSSTRTLPWRFLLWR